MTDHSVTPQANSTNAELLAANAVLLAENQRMAELLATMQNNGSISSFEEFAKLLINHFAASKIYVLDSDCLTTIKQGQHESLKVYMTHFTTVVMEIPELNQEVQLHAIKSGLRPGKFQDAISQKHWRSYEKKQPKKLKLKNYVKLEELAITSEGGGKPTKSQNRDSKKPFKLTPKFNSYTKFNTKREDIIKEILHNKLIKPPSKAGTYQDQKYVDRSKHCAFHQRYGHTTDECIIAKDLLERLARQVLLDKYVTSRSQKETRDTDKLSYRSYHKEKGAWYGPVETPASKGTINYISGGFAGGEATSTARKRSYRTIMTEGSQQQTQTSATNA
ncbi:uncharacterized protein [Arachis hypogaea]|uniref:uncharacterized protein n=1 Tax=Arachis hypogaea TaxID=3818 RepID=UPI000DEC6BD4|nr:uncharacterized protein LOC112704920 [Arachis hypogaea]